MAPRKRTSTGPRRVGIYVRISRDRDDEISTDLQRETCERVAAQRGWQIVDVYEDKGRSAWKRGVKRPAFDRLMADVSSGAVDMVLAYKLNRISRSSADFGAMLNRLDAHGAGFASATEPNLDTSGAWGKAMVQITMTFAELESGMKSEIASDVHGRRVAQNLPPSGPPAFGYVRGDARTRNCREVVPVEAAAIRDAAAAVLAGSGGYRAVARDWNARGFRTGRGLAWETRGVKHVLTSPHTAGLRDVDGVLVEGDWPAILDRDTWTALVALSDRASTGPRRARRFLLPGIAVCGRCGTPLVSRPHRSGPRYVCQRSRRFPNACGGLSVKAEETDALLTEYLLEAIDPAAVAEHARPTDALAALAALEGELIELAELYRDGTLPLAEWRIMREGVEQRIDEAAAAAQTVNLPDLDFADLAASWKQLTIDERRAWILALVDRVEVAAYVRGATTRDRLVVQWKAD
jgi:DNA invertase Pin-like site-specific DNA recombinase